jgi:Arc/MetJ-type ribon-helix-helix transcriptional regulator
MTVQITVRLPDELVEFVDALVAEGAVKSRAEAVHWALLRDRRRRVALTDVEILRERGDDPELQAFVDFTSEHPLELDD